MKSVKYAMLVAVLGLSLVGCREEPAAPANEQSSAALPAGLRLAAVPGAPQEVVEARATMKDGERVILQGVVGGRAEPIAANRSILTLLDAGISTCDQNPGDNCATPWDACCEPADVRANHSVTVQVVDAQGRPLPTSLATVEGVRPGVRLAVAGIARVSSDGVMLVEAEGIYVVN